MAGVVVDLAEASVAEEIRKRYDVFAAAADELVDGGFLDSAEVIFDEDLLTQAVEAYYLMSEAYKSDKLRGLDLVTSRTEKSKKAALTAISLMVFRPFRFIVTHLTKDLSYVANQTLAMECAGSFLEKDFPLLKFEMQRRLFRYLDTIGKSIRVNCLKDYLDDQAAGNFKSTYLVDIDTDLPLIDAAILIFESPLA